MNRLPLFTRLALALLMLVGFMLLLAQDGPHPGRITLWVIGTAVLGAWLGWGVRQVWIYPRRLRKAQALWATHRPASEVADMLEGASLATGELGRQVHLLMGHAHFALGYRNSAWRDFLQADLSRLPFWLRWPAHLAFRGTSEAPTPRQLARAARLSRRAPTVARLRHFQGILLLRTGAIPEAWSHFEAALPLAWEDPLLLEDLLLASIRKGRDDLAEASLAALRSRHGDPRLPWDRGEAALYLLRKERAAEAQVLLLGLPSEGLTTEATSLATAMAQRQLGDPEGAWHTIQTAVLQHPGSFGLWMERHRIALDLQDEKEALASLECAWRALPEGAQGEPHRQEWHLHRAEFAFWWENQPESARQHLAKVPVHARGNHHPPLELQLRVALGDHEGVYREVTDLLTAHPLDADLRLLQADCMAGMAAWEALLPLLDAMDEPCRQQPLFWHLKGLALANLGQPYQARLDLVRAVHMSPQDPRLLLDAGHACAEMGDWIQAEAFWHQALLLAPQTEEALLNLAEAHLERHDPEGARRFLRECLLHHPDSRQAQAALAELEVN